MKILGIDPGFGTLGWAVVDKTPGVVEYGVIETLPNSAIDERLLKIHTRITEIIKKHKPDCVAIESLFFAKNTKTALDVSKCIGVILLTTRLAGLNYKEYTPLQIKTALTGYGRASKEQVLQMVVRLYKLKEVPRPDDVADALAIAACHSFSMNVLKIKTGRSHG